MREKKIESDVGKSKIMRCLRYIKGGSNACVILRGEQLEEVDCFMYLGSQMAADGGCEWNGVH